MSGKLLPLILLTKIPIAGLISCSAKRLRSQLASASIKLPRYQSAYHADGLLEWEYAETVCLAGSLELSAWSNSAQDIGHSFCCRDWTPQSGI